MHEDKLTHDERLRLEALAQAIQAQGVVRTGAPPSAEVVVETAKTFEKYVSGRD